MRGSLEMVQKRSLIDPQFLQSQDLGEITPAFLRSGPVQTRSCTDIICLLLFWLATICLIIIMVLGFSSGDPKLLYVGYDVADNACGDGDYSNYPYLYFYNTTAQEDGVWDTICVSECPQEGDTTISCGVNSVITDCSDSSITIYDSYAYMGFLCLPTNETLYEEIEDALEDVTGLVKILLEIWNNWRLICISMGIAFFIGIISIFLTIWIPHTIIFFFLLCVFVGFLGIGSIFILDYVDPELLFSILETNSDNNNATESASIDEMLSSVSDEFKIIMAVACFVFALVVLIYTIVGYKQIYLLMKVLKSTALFIQARKLFIFISFVFFVFLMGYIIIWTVVLLYLYTWEDLNDTETYTTPFYHFQTSSIAIFFIIIHSIGFFWNVAFILYTYNFVLAASCVYWYFSHSDWIEYERKLPHPLKLAIRIYFRYHFGSVAQGAFLMLFFRWFNASFGIFYVHFMISHLNILIRIRLRNLEGRVLTSVLNIQQKHVCAFFSVTKKSLDT